MDKRSIKLKIIVFLVVVSSAAVLTLAAGWFLTGRNFRAEKEVVKELKNNFKKTDKQSQIGDSADKKDKSETGAEGAVMASENYRIGQIKFGGDAIFLSGNSEIIPLEIYDARSETVSSENGKNHKLMIVWKTSKLAASEVEYSEIGGQNPKTVRRDDYGFDHSVILSNLEPATAYVYKIKAKDRWGNETASDYFGAYTGRKADSVFELVAKAIEEVFGWAMRK